MPRNTIGHLGTLALLAVCTLAACDRTAIPTDPSFARGGVKGKGGSGTTEEQPTMAVSPTQSTLTVGQQATFAVTYWDKQGNVIPTTDGKVSYWGCAKVVDTDPDCWSVVAILPLQPYAREAQITAKAPGTVKLYASDGLGTWVWATVTVQ